MFLPGRYRTAKYRDTFSLKLSSAAEHSSQLTVFRYDVAFPTLAIITQGYEFFDDKSELKTTYSVWSELHGSLEEYLQHWVRPHLEEMVFRLLSTSIGRSVNCFLIS